MLGRLALRNAKRSMKDYTIYILSVTIIFSLIYAFNTIIFSEDILMLSEVMNTLIYAITVVSIIIIFASAWLVHYMNNFMLQRRSREFGIYMTLGISNRVIARIFLRENIILGTLSYMISLVAGSFLYQILSLIIMHMFEATYQVKIVFSIKALLLSLLYVCLIYAFSLIRSKRKLRKMKINHLLNADKKNETMMLKNLKGNWIIFVLSILLGIFGGKLLWDAFSGGEGNATLLRMGMAFICSISCIYGFYISLSSVLVKFFIENKRLKYKKDICLLVRSLSAKMNTMRITLGTLGMLLTFTLTSLSIGMLLKGYLEEQVEAVLPFDIAICRSKEDYNFDIYKDYINQNYTVEGDLNYPIYKSGSRTVYDKLEESIIGGSYFQDDTVMKYSDYQKLRKILGYPPVELEEGHYLIQGTMGVKDFMEKEGDLPLCLGGRTLKYQGCYQENFALQGINGAYYLIIIPDELVQNMEVRQIVYIVKTKEKTRVEDAENLEQYNQPQQVIATEETTVSYDNLDYINVKGARLAENRSTFTIVSFSLFYLGLVLICIAATILAVQMLSDAMQYKFRYKILHNLGMEEKRIDGYILKQCLFYFVFPLLLPIPFSIYITVCVNRLVEALISNNIISVALGTSVGLFLLIYLMYFVATFISYRKNVYE